TQNPGSNACEGPNGPGRQPPRKTTAPPTAWPQSFRHAHGLAGSSSRCGLVREDAGNVLVARRVPLLAIVVGTGRAKVGVVEEGRRVQLGRVVVVHVLGRLDPAEEFAVVAERVLGEERPGHPVPGRGVAPLPGGEAFARPRGGRAGLVVA